MSFNPDLNEQAQERSHVFKTKLSHRRISLNNVSVSRANVRKHY